MNFSALLSRCATMFGVVCYIYLTRKNSAAGTIRLPQEREKYADRIQRGKYIGKQKYIGTGDHP